MRVSPEQQHLEEQHARGPHRRCAPEPGQDVLRDERLHRKEQEGREEGGEKIERYNLLSRGIPGRARFVACVWPINRRGHLGNARRSPHTRRARPRTDPAPAQPRSWPDVYAKGSSWHKGTGSPPRRGPEFDRPVPRLLAPSSGCTGRPAPRTSPACARRACGWPRARPTTAAPSTPPACRRPTCTPTTPSVPACRAPSSPTCPPTRAPARPPARPPPPRAR